MLNKLENYWWLPNQNVQCCFPRESGYCKTQFCWQGKFISQIIVDFKLYFQLLLCLSFIQHFCNIGQIELWNRNIFHVIKAIDWESGYRKTNWWKEIIIISKYRWFQALFPTFTVSIFYPIVLQNIGQIELCNKNDFHIISYLIFRKATDYWLLPNGVLFSRRIKLLLQLSLIWWRK